MNPLNWLRWLRDREPVWMVAGAAAVLDAVSHLVPAVPARWHPGVDIVIAVLTLLAQRRLAWSWDSVAKAIERHQPPSAAGEPVTPPLALTGGGHVQIVHYPPGADPASPATELPR